MLIVVMQPDVKDIIEIKTNKKLQLPGGGDKRRAGQTYLLTYIFDATEFNYLQFVITHTHTASQ